MEFYKTKFRKTKPKYPKDTGTDARRAKSSKNRGGGRPRDRGVRSMMHDAKCGDCGADCKIPFEPRQGRAVLCDKCFRRSTPPEERRSKQAPRRDRREKTRDKAFTKQKGYFEGGSEKFYGNLREKLFEILGGKKCASCGFSDERALGFRDVKDKNVFGDIRRGSAAASWGKYISNPDLARKNLKVLCLNCNQIRE